MRAAWRGRSPLPECRWRTGNSGVAAGTETAGRLLVGAVQELGEDALGEVDEDDGESRDLPDAVPLAADPAVVGLLLDDAEVLRRESHGVDDLAAARGGRRDCPPPRRGGPWGRGKGGKGEIDWGNLLVTDSAAP